MSRRSTSSPASTSEVFSYAAGEGVNSLSSNSMGNFGFLYLTLIIGLDPVLAGIALSVSMFWDAVTDPVMGHISDSTRSRWGRRHPYLILGGISLALIFAAYWKLPQALAGNTTAALTVLIILQLLFKTAQTIYFVPFTALGFEMCPTYEQRASLQGKRWFVNQVLNFVFGALAWPLFFPDVIDSATGATVNGSHIASNYVTMGLVLAAVIAGLSVTSAWTTRRFGPDNRTQPRSKESIRAFWKDFISTIGDRLAIYVIAFAIITGFAMGFMAQTQMYTYVFFMEFAPWEKTFVHGSGMITMSLLALALPWLVRRMDKKPAGMLGIGIAIAGGLGLFTVFSTGLMAPKTLPLFAINGQPFHLSTVVFGLLQMCWWGGCGIVVPLATSMIADVAAINARATGQPPKNASYASVYSFSQKLSWTVTGLIIGAAIKASGFVAGSQQQTAESVQGIANLTFLAGPVIMVAAAILLTRYPITRDSMADVEAAR